MCTLKSFPYQPEHCIGWARSVFDQLFEVDPRLVKGLLDQPAGTQPVPTLPHPHHAVATNLSSPVNRLFAVSGELAAC